MLKGVSKKLPANTDIKNLTPTLNSFKYASFRKRSCLKGTQKKNLKASQRLLWQAEKRVHRCQNVVEKGMTYSYVGRKLKKREYRRLWIARINAAVREEGLTYSQFMNLLGKKEISLDRKVLADLAMNNAESFKALVAQVK